MSEPLRELLHKTHELAELTDALTRHAIERDFTAMALDVSAITKNTTEITRIAQAAQAGDSAAIKEAVAAQLETDQAAVDDAASDQAAALAPLSAEFPASPSSTFAVSPSSVSVPVGSSLPVPVTISGADGSVSASGLPSGVTFDGTGNLVPDGTQVAGTSTVTFSDSATPPNEAEVTVTVA